MIVGSLYLSRNRYHRLLTPGYCFRLRNMNSTLLHHPAPVQRRPPAPDARILLREPSDTAVTTPIGCGTQMSSYQTPRDQKEAAIDAKHSPRSGIACSGTSCVHYAVSAVASNGVQSQSTYTTILGGDPRRASAMRCYRSGRREKT